MCVRGEVRVCVCVCVWVCMFVCVCLLCENREWDDKPSGVCVYVCVCVCVDKKESVCEIVCVCVTMHCFWHCVANLFTFFTVCWVCKSILPGPNVLSNKNVDFYFRAHLHWTRLKQTLKDLNWNGVLQYAVALRSCLESNLFSPFLGFVDVFHSIGHIFKLLKTICLLHILPRITNLK